MSTKEITPYKNFDVSTLIFSEPKMSNNAFKNQRIYINVPYENGIKGDLIFEMPPNLYSFGVKANQNKNTGQVDGYSLPVYLYDNDGATTEELEFVRVLDEICRESKRYLLANKKEIGKPRLHEVHLENMSPIYMGKRDENGEPMPGAKPSLYMKLIAPRNKENNGFKFITDIYDANTGDIVNPVDMIDKRCTVNAALKIESIFISTDGKFKLQVKLWEADVSFLNARRKRLLRSPALSQTFPRHSNDRKDEEFDEVDIAGSIPQSEDEVDFVSTRKKVRNRKNCGRLHDAQEIYTNA